MRSTVKLPKLGDTADEVLVREWLVEVGDDVTTGDPLMSVETDKVEVDVPSPVTGRIIEKLVTEDTEIAVGHPIAVIES